MLAGLISRNSRPVVANWAAEEKETVAGLAWSKVLHVKSPNKNLSESRLYYLRSKISVAMGIRLTV